MKNELKTEIETALKAAGFNRKQATVACAHGWHYTVSVWDHKIKKAVEKAVKHLHTFNMDNTDLRTGNAVNVEMPYKVRLAGAADTKQYVGDIKTTSILDEETTIMGIDFKRHKNRGMLVAYDGEKCLGTIDVTAYGDDDDALASQLVKFLF